MHIYLAAIATEKEKGTYAKRQKKPLLSAEDVRTQSPFITVWKIFSIEIIQKRIDLGLIINSGWTPLYWIAVILQDGVFNTLFNICVVFLILIHLKCNCPTRTKYFIFLKGVKSIWKLF